MTAQLRTADALLLVVRAFVNDAVPHPLVQVDPLRDLRLLTEDLILSDLTVLDGVVKTLKDNPDTKVVIEGHTDSIGGDAYNKKLSERRAEAVKRYLVRQGIDAGRIRTVGHGKTKPVADNGTEEGRAKNRRAEVVVE